MLSPFSNNSSLVKPSLDDFETSIFTLSLVICSGDVIPVVSISTIICVSFNLVTPSGTFPSVNTYLCIPLFNEIPSIYI